jgi:hypothetical protein
MYNPAVDKPRQSHQLVLEALPQPQSPLPYLDDYVLSMTPEVVESEDRNRFDNIAFMVGVLSLCSTIVAVNFENEQLVYGLTTLGVLSAGSIMVRHAGAAIYKKLKSM